MGSINNMPSFQSPVCGEYSPMDSLLLIQAHSESDGSLVSCLFLSFSLPWNFSLISPRFSGSIDVVVAPKLWSKPNHKFYQSECIWTRVSTPRCFAAMGHLHSPTKISSPIFSSEARPKLENVICLAPEHRCCKSIHTLYYELDFHIYWWIFLPTMHLLRRSDLKGYVAPSTLISFPVDCIIIDLPFASGECFNISSFSSCILLSVCNRCLVCSSEICHVCCYNLQTCVKCILWYNINRPPLSLYCSLQSYQIAAIVIELLRAKTKKPCEVVPVFPIFLKTFPWFSDTLCIDWHILRKIFLLIATPSHQVLATLKTILLNQYYSQLDHNPSPPWNEIHSVLHTKYLQPEYSSSH